MMKSDMGLELIEQLKKDPDGFFNSGKSIDLLQAYFNGLSLETLIPLLQSNNEKFTKPIIWIVSELADRACPLLDYVVPLISSEDSYIKYYALECISTCSTGCNVQAFIHVISSIDCADLNFSLLAMELLSKANKNQLEAAIQQASNMQLANGKLHQDGLEKLLNYKQIDNNTVFDLLDSPQQILNQYGVIIAAKLFNESPKLIEYASLSDNVLVKEYVEWVEK